MILHFYSPEIPLAYCKWNVHNGHGLGSIFARLFSKIAGKTAAIASKTALKAALTAGKSVAKSGLKTVIRKATPLVKEGIKQGISQATKFGTESALSGINSLAEKAKKKGLPAPLVHKISQAVEKQAIHAAEKIAQKTEKKLYSGVDTVRHLIAPAVREKRKRKPAKGPARKRKKGLDQSLLEAL